jgi:hypothetical protein
MSTIKLLIITAAEGMYLSIEGTDVRVKIDQHFPEAVPLHEAQEDFEFLSNLADFVQVGRARVTMDGDLLSADEIRSLAERDVSEILGDVVPHRQNHQADGNDALANGLSTGILYGGTLTVNGLDNTKFDITAGAGVVVDHYTDPTHPTLVFVSWPAQTAVTDPYIAASTETFVSIDSSGGFVFSTTAPDEILRRDYIHVGWTSHIDLATLDDAFTEPVFAVDALQQLTDFLAAFGPFNISGNVYNANSTDLTIQRSAGKTFDDGSNFRLDPKSPSIISSLTETPVPDIWYFYRDPGEPTGWKNDLPSVAVIDPDSWDDGTGVLASVPLGKFTIQLVTFYAPWNATDVQYGQVLYNTMADAEAAVTTAVDLNPWNAQWDTLRGWIVVVQGATDLSNPSQAKFIIASRFGMIQGVAGSTGVVATHKDTHRSGGTDAFVPTDVIEAIVKRVRETSGPTVLTLGAVADGQLLKRSGADIVGTTVVPLHKDTHKSGGTDAFTSADILEAVGKRLQETSGPTVLTLGAVADGQLLKRSGTDIVGTLVVPLHKDTHKVGGTDAFASTDILDATVRHLQESTGPTTLDVGAIADGQLLKRSGAFIVGTLTLPLHKDTHKVGGSDAFVSTDLIDAAVHHIQESAGPTTLDVGAIADGQFLRRSGTSIIGTSTLLLHKDTHKSGGTDAFTSTDILEAIVKRLQESGGPTTLTLGSIPDGNLLIRSGGTIIGTTTLPLHKDTHKSGGTDAFTSADILEAIVKRLQESGGPTTLTMGAVVDGQLLRRSGTSIVGETIAVFGQSYQSVSEVARTTYNGGTGFQTKGPPMTIPAGLTGTYRVSWTAVVDQSNTAQYTEAQLYNVTDAVIVGVVQAFRPNNAAERQHVGGFAEIAPAGAAKTFQIQFRTTLAAATAGIADARVEFWRVS